MGGIMAAEVGGLLINLGLDVAAIRQDVGKANRELTGFRQKVDRQMGKAQRAFKKATSGVKGLAAALGAQQLGAAIGRTLSSFEEINRQARSLGASRENIQELQFAFRQFGLEQKDVTDALATVSDRADDALGGMQSFIDDFERFGIEVDDLRGKAPGELFRTVAQGISELDTEQQQVTAAVRLFGDEVGQRLLPLLNEGASGIDKYAQRARELGVIVSDELVKDSAKAAKDFRALKEILTAQFARTIAQNAEELQATAKALTDIAVWGSRAAAALVDVGKNMQFAPGEANLFKVDSLEGVNSELERLNKLLDRIQNSRAGKQGILGDEEEVKREIRQLKARRELLEREQGSGGSDTELDPINVTGGSRRGSDAVVFPSMTRMGRRSGSNFEAMIEIQNQTKSATEETNREYEESRQLLRRIDQQAKDMKQQGNGLGFAFKSAFEDAIIEGKKFSDVLKGLAEDISRLILRKNVTEPLAKSVNSVDFGSMIAGFFGSNSSSLGTGTGSSPAMASGRAAGGPVKQNETYMVGENGPELFTPGRSGGITPNGRMGGNVTVNIINEGGERLQSSGQRERRGPNGERQIDVMVKSSIQRLDAQGELDGTFRRHGANRQGQF